MDRSSRILLCQPKFPVNLANVVRAAACWDAKEVLWTGERCKLDETHLPRELRMKQYSSVTLTRTERPFDVTPGVVPICVEVMDAVSLPDFVHPPNALYVFGPEDGSVPQVYRRLCHQFVTIPSKHCLNLAAAVNVVLFHRFLQEAKHDI